MNGPADESVTCPICSRVVHAANINAHLDKGCPGPSTKESSQPTTAAPPASQSNNPSSSQPMSSSSQAKRQREPAGISNKPTKPSKRQKVTTTATAVPASASPLAEQLRPQSLQDFVGQPHLTGPNAALARGAKNGVLGSMILWGPPGCGKTTLARLLAKESGSIFKELSATSVGINDVRALVEEAKNTLVLTGTKTVLFLDEVHRFNKSQQDIFLPFVEQGQIQLIGATTENPSFRLTGALLSRCRVYTLEALSEADIEKILTSAVLRWISQNQSEPSSSALVTPTSSPDQSGLPIPSCPQFTPLAKSTIVGLANGDARTALGLLELLLQSPSTAKESDIVSTLKQSASVSYDRTGDDRYDMISALHKSVRGSQPDAALYWLARMLTSGEDPLYICRRMVVCASEDVGLADEKALPLAIATMQACQLVGMPECRINLAHIVSYLSIAKKDTRAYGAYARAEEVAKETHAVPVPLDMRNAPTKLMGDLGYGKGYHYNPDYQHPVTNQYLPQPLENKQFFRQEGDLEGKIWDEKALQEWEVKENNNQSWSGRG